MIGILQKSTPVRIYLHKLRKKSQSLAVFMKYRTSQCSVNIFCRMSMQHVLPGAATTSGCLALKPWGEFFTTNPERQQLINGLSHRRKNTKKYLSCFFCKETFSFLQTLRCHIVTKGHRQRVATAQTEQSSRTLNHSRQVLVIYFVSAMSLEMHRCLQIE